MIVGSLELFLVDCRWIFAPPMLPVMRSTVPKYFSQVPLTCNRQQPLAFTDDPDYLNGGIDKIANDAFSDRLGGKFPNGAPGFSA